MSLLNPIKKERISNTEQDEADKDKLLKCLLSSPDIKITSYLGVFLALQRLPGIILIGISSPCNVDMNKFSFMNKWKRILFVLEWKKTKRGDEQAICKCNVKRLGHDFALLQVLKKS